MPGVRFLQAACPACWFLAQRVHWSLPKRCSVSAQVILLLQRRAVERCVGAVCGEWRVLCYLSHIGFSEWPPFCSGIVVGKTTFTNIAE